MSIVLTSIVIWLLINVLFVFLVVPPRKPRRRRPPGSTHMVPVQVDSRADPLDIGETADRTSIPLMLWAVLLSVFLSPSLVMIGALDTIRGYFRRRFRGSKD